MRERNAAMMGPMAIEAAREVALRQLDTRARSHAQLRSAITSRGFSSEIAEEVLQRLSRVGLVDDRMYAQALVRDGFLLKGRVGPALAQDLRRAGISDAIASELLGTISREEQYERALDLAERKKRSLRGLRRDVARRRLGSALARKGYSASLISSVLADVLADMALGDLYTSGEDGNDEY